MSEDLFGYKTEDDDVVDSATPDSPDKEHYDALVARERFRRAKMENDLRAGKLVYVTEPDQVLGEVLSAVLNAFAGGIDSLPDDLVGLSKGGIRERLMAHYQQAIDQAHVRLNEYRAKHTGVTPSA